MASYVLPRQILSSNFRKAAAAIVVGAPHNAPASLVIPIFCNPSAGTSLCSCYRGKGPLLQHHQQQSRAFTAAENATSSNTPQRNSCEEKRATAPGKSGGKISSAPSIQVAIHPQYHAAQLVARDAADMYGGGAVIPQQQKEACAGSLLPPPPIVGIRRAPREAPEGPAAAVAGTEGRMRIRLPPIGSKMRDHIDPRMDYIFPLTVTFVALGPIYWFAKSFF